MQRVRYPKVSEALEVNAGKSSRSSFSSPLLSLIFPKNFIPASATLMQQFGFTREEIHTPINSNLNARVRTQRSRATKIASANLFDRRSRVNSHVPGQRVRISLGRRVVALFRKYGPSTRRTSPSSSIYAFMPVVCDTRSLAPPYVKLVPMT